MSKDAKDYLYMIIKWKWAMIAAIFLTLVIVFASYALRDNEETVSNELETRKAQTLPSTAVETANIADEKQKEIVVDIKGAVKHPNTYRMKLGDRVEDVLKRAELTADADGTHINLSEKLTDQKMIIIPKKGEIPVAHVDASKNKIAGSTGAMDNPIINLNSATVDELTTVKGIGRRKAEAIIQHRESKGPFTKVEDLQAIKGFGDKTIEKLKAFLTV